MQQPLSDADANRSPELDDDNAIPRYLADIYWWAYIHPAGVALFDHPFVVNLILWGNFPRLRDAALRALGPEPLSGHTLQVACVYGDLTNRLARRLHVDGWLEVVDVVPRQLHRLRSKLGTAPRVVLKQANGAHLGGAPARFDRALIFFLLHEQPEAVRRATLSEVIRTVKPGGRVVIVDYHRPHRLHPLRWVMQPILRCLEPFALDLWRDELDKWLPPHVLIEQHELHFGGLYQLLVLSVQAPAAQPVPS